MKLKISKGTLIAMMEFMAKADVRYYLNGICFDPSGEVYATDGYRLAIGNHENKIEEQVIVSVGKRPACKYSHAIIDTEQKIISFMPEFATGENIPSERVGVSTCGVVDGKYPDVKRVIPKTKEACDEIGFNAEYLASIGKVAKAINPRCAFMKLTLQGSNGAAIAEISGPYDTIKVVVMPMRI